MTFYINIADNCPPNTAIPVKVEISSDYYTLWTDTIPFLVLGPSNIEEINTLPARVYPNPVQNILHIDLSGKTGVLEILDISGKVLLHNQIEKEVIGS